MDIQKNRVVSIDYVLKNSAGVLIDQSDGEPLVYLHGNENIITGLEKHLEGKKAGDSVDCIIAAAEAYGERDEELVFSVSRKDFAEPEKIEIGMQFQTQEEDGVRAVTVVGVADDEVKIDANHPLAGQSLHFAVTVNDVREASAEELDHGHVHGHSHDDHDHDHDCDCDGDGSCDDEGGCGCSGCGH